MRSLYLQSLHKLTFIDLHASLKLSHHQKHGKILPSVETDDGDVAVHAAGDQLAAVDPDVPDGLPVMAQRGRAKPSGMLPDLKQQ